MESLSFECEAACNKHPTVGEKSICFRIARCTCDDCEDGDAGNNYAINIIDD